MMLATTSQRLSHFVKTLGLTHQQFASDVNTSRTAMAAILSGARPLSKGMLARIASKYPQLNLKWLHNGDGEMLNQGTTIGDSDFIGGNGDIIKKNVILTKEVKETEVEISESSKEENEITRLKCMLFDLQEQNAALKAKLKRAKEEIKKLKDKFNL